METNQVVENGKIVEVAKIPEFDFWQRRLVKACWQAGEKLVSCWPHMWPVDKEERESLGLDPSTKTLEQIKKIIGVANFNSEYLANPGSDDTVYFSLDERKHSWSVIQGSIDKEFGTNPKASKAVMKWFSGEEERSSTIEDFVKGCRLFIAIDTSKTARIDSDFKVATLMAVNKEHDLFVLDMWAAKCHPELLIEETFNMAERWGCRYISPERIDDGETLERTMRNIVFRANQAGRKMPVVKGFNPGYTRKEAKIGALLFRFEHGKIKFPFFMRMKKPWCDLFEQVEGFNPDVDNGGLQHDDHLDTVSMSEYIMGAKILRAPEDATQEETDVLKLIEKGETYTSDGTPLVQFLDLQNMPLEDLEHLASKRLNPSKGSVL